MNKIWRDETDIALAEAASRYLSGQYRFEVRQRQTQDERRFDARIWESLADMGWLSVATAEEHGGLGLRVSSICLLAEAAGRALLTEPLLSTGVLASYLIARYGDAKQRAEILPQVLAGKLRIVCMLEDGVVRNENGLLHGQREVVVDADIAERILVKSANRLWLVDANAGSVKRKSYPLLDGRGAATVTFNAAPCHQLGSGETVDLREAMLLAALATAADSHGAMSAAFELTLEYLKTRQQFGRSLGTNQALQHRAVDMYVAIGLSRAVLEQAIQSFQINSPDAARDVHAAKALIGESARRVTQEAIQLHGGIGVTEEYAVSHYLRRARVNEQLWGCSEKHLIAFASSAPATAN